MDNIEDLARKAKEWALSPEGQEAMADALRKTEEMFGNPRQTRCDRCGRLHLKGTMCGRCFRR